MKNERWFRNVWIYGGNMSTEKKLYHGGMKLLQMLENQRRKLSHCILNLLSQPQWVTLVSMIIKSSSKRELTLTSKIFLAYMSSCSSSMRLPIYMNFPDSITFYFSCSITSEWKMELYMFMQVKMVKFYHFLRFRCFILLWLAWCLLCFVLFVCLFLFFLLCVRKKNSPTINFFWCPSFYTFWLHY